MKSNATHPSYFCRAAHLKEVPRHDTKTAIQVIAAEGAQCLIWVSNRAGVDWFKAGVLSQSTKDTVLEQAGAECACCGEDDAAVLQIDHIWPRSKGGQNWLINLQVLCADCNKRKGNSLVLRTPAELLKLLMPWLNRATARRIARWMVSNLSMMLRTARDLSAWAIKTASKLAREAAPWIVMLLAVLPTKVWLAIAAVIVIALLIWWASRHRPEWFERARSTGRRARDTVVSRLRRVPTAPARAIRGVRTRAEQVRGDIGRRMPGMDWHLEREEKHAGSEPARVRVFIEFNRYGVAEVVAA